jgi:uncharacterized protein YdeI (BOF family)
MRVFIAAAVALVMLSLPAQAQRGGGKRHQGQAQTDGAKKPKVDEKAYKGALDAIPERKADPWAKIR